MTSYVTPKKNVAYKFYVGLIDQSNTKLLKANPTIASGDFKVSTDGGAFANLATLPSANPASGRAIMIDLSNTEMNGDNIVVQCVDAAGAEWCDLLLNIQTTARQIDDLAYPATTGRSMVVDASGLVDANAVKLGPTGAGTAQTARDVGASVLLSAGSGTGQLDFTSGVVKANATQWLGGTIPAVNVTGVPLVDAKYLLGTVFPTPTVAGVPNVNVKTWNDLATVALPLVPTTAGRTLDVTAANKVNGVVLVDTVTTYTGNTPQTGDAFARIGAPVGASISADIAEVEGETDTLLAGVTVTTNNDKTGYRLSATGVNDILRTVLTEGYAADGAAFTLEQGAYMIWALLAERTIASTTLTANKLDGSTAAMTFTLDSATTPTSQTRAT